jgi:excisionase family DNA binding protein
MKSTTDYPLILTVDHVSEIMGVSKRIAYEMMEYKGFPLIRIGRLKRVNREAFFGWLEKQAN